MPVKKSLWFKSNFEWVERPCRILTNLYHKMLILKLLNNAKWANSCWVFVPPVVSEIITTEMEAELHTRKSKMPFTPFDFLLLYGWNRKIFRISLENVWFRFRMVYHTGFIVFISFGILIEFSILFASSFFLRRGN